MKPSQRHPFWTSYAKRTIFDALLRGEIIYRWEGSYETYIRGKAIGSMRIIDELLAGNYIEPVPECVDAWQISPEGVRLAEQFGILQFLQGQEPSRLDLARKE